MLLGVEEGEVDTLGLTEGCFDGITDKLGFILGQELGREEGVDEGFEGAKKGMLYYSSVVHCFSKVSYKQRLP